MAKSSGRRTKSEGPALPRAEIDRLLVHGEVVEDSEGKGADVRYPTYRDLAKRFGVSHSLIAQYSTAHNCMARRKQTEKRVKEMADQRLAELRADDLAVSRDDAIRIIDRYVIAFEEALEDGRVRCDNPTDFNTLMRLKALLLGNADSRQELLGGLTLEDLQQRHRAMLDTWESSTPEMRGESPEGASANDVSDGREIEEDADPSERLH